jgi:hypothetical protein
MASYLSLRSVVGADADVGLLSQRQVSIRYDSTLVSTSHSLCACCVMVNAVCSGGGTRGLTCGVVLVPWLCGLCEDAGSGLLLRCQVSIRYDSPMVSASHSLCICYTMVAAVRSDRG